MGNHLLPCPGCARHVRALDPMCPFCGAALPTSVRASQVPRIPLKRLGRSATLAFGAALSMAGCGDAGNGHDDAGRMSLQDSGGNSDEDAGKIFEDGGEDAGTNVALYGGPPPQDAGMDAGTSVALYGCPP